MNYVTCFQWQRWRLFIIYRNWKCCCIIFVSIDPNMAAAKKSLLVVQEWNLLGGQGLLIQMPSGYAAASFIDGLWIGLDWSKVYGEGWGSTAFSRLLTPHFTTTAILGLNTNSEQFINILLFCRSLWITMSSYCQGFHLKTIGRLKIHVETHIDDKSFKCSQCQYVSKQTGHMFC